MGRRRQAWGLRMELVWEADTCGAWGGGLALTLRIPAADPKSGRQEAWDGREFRQARVTDRPLAWGHGALSGTLSSLRPRLGTRGERPRRGSRQTPTVTLAPERGAAWGLWSHRQTGKLRASGEGLQHRPGDGLPAHAVPVTRTCPQRRALPARRSARRSASRARAPCPLPCECAGPVSTG